MLGHLLVPGTAKVPNADGLPPRRFPRREQKLVQTSTALEGAAINDIADMKRGFIVSLRASNRSPKTIKSYVEAVDLYRKLRWKLVFRPKSTEPTETMSKPSSWTS